MIRKTFPAILFMLFTVACMLIMPAADGTATPPAFDNTATPPDAALPSPTAFGSSPTTTVEPLPVPPEKVTATPEESPQAESQFIAYISFGHLLVSDVTDGVLGGTTQYSVAGQSDQVTDLAWSPSGEFVAFVSVATGEPHIFYVFALGQSSPTDLGPGSALAWSPDNQSVAYIGGAFPDENIWVTTIENPTPRQLTFESNFAWGRPVFTPDGSSLVVAGTSRDNMGASGNTNFTLEYLALDGSGTRTPLPGAAPFEGGRLPYDMHFSPDGTRLAYSTSFHLSACASPGAYYIANADGGNLQTLVSPSMQAAIDPNLEQYHVGLSYAWTPSSDAIVALGNVVDCDLNSPTAGQTIAGPQMSILGLDGSERTIIPGFFYEISVDRSGSLIAAGHYQDGFQDMTPDLEIYSAQSGQLVLSLGAGSNPQFQP